MDKIEQLKKTVNNRVVGIMSHGKSIEELEKRIVEFKDFNVCWASFNLFSVMEDFILNRIHKKLDLVLDGCPSKSVGFDINVRIKDFKRIINRGTLFISSKSLLEPYKDFYNEYKDKIIFLGELFPIPIQYSPNSSICILIYVLALCGASKIILFGYDGYKDKNKWINSYYKKDIQIKRQYSIKGTTNPFPVGVSSHKQDFEKYFMKSYEFLRDNYNIQLPEIINCSNISIYNTFKKVSYDELKEIL